MAEDDHLAYGDYPGQDPAQGEEGERGFVGDTFRKLRTNDGLGSFFKKVHETVHGFGNELGGRTKPASAQGQGQYTATGAISQHRYNSFAEQREGNDVKWFVDGCGYMWAVSIAIERARESIWILDWWLSPELYLRRPPSKHEQYRLDRMLQAAAQRGVKVNIIVYKEVTQALTRKYLSPTLPNYLHSLLPRETDPFTSGLTKLGIAATFASLEHVEGGNPLMSPPISVSSSHTKHALEDLHPNISVFRHPDHLPDAQTLQSSFISSLQNLSLTAATAAKLSGGALKAIYGMNDDVVLYWAHQLVLLPMRYILCTNEAAQSEKLCLIDGHTAFMGGLDLCYGRWDTNQHSIADAHPGDLNDIVFPGQDFNNARIMDFADVAHWENNKLDRKESSRMGWSDISISLHGPVVEDLRAHFVERWNFIYNEKYDVRKDVRYSRLSFGMSQPPPSSDHQPQGRRSEYQQSQQAATQPSGYGNEAQPNKYSDQGQGEGGLYFPPPPSSARGLGADEQEGARGLGESQDQRHHHLHHLEAEGEAFKERIEGHVHHHMGGGRPLSGEPARGAMACQIVRSAAKWSNGNKETEHSIANSYISVIQNSQHFIYIENQFFITATSEKQRPIKNMIGAAIADRIIRAARAGEKYKVIVVMPAIPAFAGDLKDDASLGTRAIMEFQYDSINRGGFSILETIANAGFNPMDYIRFYNLRNYDRINASASMRRAELDSGVDYELARREHDDMVDPAGYRAQGGIGYAGESASHENYEKYQQSASRIPDQGNLGNGRWDSVAECYMLGGPDIREVPWEDGDISEIDAFVSEELYVHSKVLIADDRVVICGSANLNDRSQLGYHDSEIAIIIEDPETVESYMDGRPYHAAKFAASLRRQLFRKHLGLVRPQDIQTPTANFQPIGVPNDYDFNSPEDQAVADPLSDTFLNLWNSRARQNTTAFGRIFHPVPHDDVQTWADYDAFYEKNFHEADQEADGKSGGKKPAKYRWGHVVADNFSPGQQGVVEMKDLLSTIKGTLVEMPLLFLIKEDIAKEGLSLNAFTEEVYT